MRIEVNIDHLYVLRCRLVKISFDATATFPQLNSLANIAELICTNANVTLCKLANAELQMVLHEVGIVDIDVDWNAKLLNAESLISVSPVFKNWMLFLPYNNFLPKYEFGDDETVSNQNHPHHRS